MRKFIILALVSLIAAQTYAVSKAQADSAYVREDYAAAAVLYDSLLTAEGPSSEIYYNLGNCYYKTDEIAKCVLNYERALLIAPGDDDIRFNLELARSKTIDRIIPHHEIFLVTWWRSLVNMTDADTWGVYAVSAFVAMLLLLMFYLFATSLWVQKTAFYSGAVLLVLCILFNICAWSQSDKQFNRTGAIVMSPSAIVRSTPSASGTDLFVLHEGTRVEILDDTMTEWKEVQIADGKKGWIEKKVISKI